MAYLTVWVPADVKAWLRKRKRTVNKSGVVTAAFRALMEKEANK